jgi:alkylation response protein AidB-like acyl-CoA dehydrogenase
VDWQDTPEQAAFRAEVRRVIAESLPERYRRGESDWIHDRVSDDPAAREAAQSWGDALSKRGWFAPHWPKEYGGAGLSPTEQFIFRQEMALADAPPVGGSGVLQHGQTLIVHGSEEQKQEHLPRILRGEEILQTGLSEPGAGSDLASLQTRAVRDGDEYVVNGQKIWSSNAHLADCLWVLVRTDPEAPKRRGISALLIDTKLPGITIRPLINMGWTHGFNETFFEDVRVPVRNRVGEENRGWYVGMTSLDFERSSIGSAIGVRRSVEMLVHYLRDSAEPASEAHRGAIAQNYVETEVAYNLSLRVASMQSAGRVPNYEASMAKVVVSELQQRVARSGTRVVGLYANLWDEHDAYTPLHAEPTHAYVSSVPMTIAGGTNEIQRNIIATRGLGLPRA